MSRRLAYSMCRPHVTPARLTKVSVAIRVTWRRPQSCANSRAAMRSSSDVVVVGGGFVGLSAAAALAARGHRVTVLESHQGTDPRFRGELIHPKGVRALDALGLKPVLEAAGAVPVQGFAVTRGPGAEATRLPYPLEAGQGLGIDHHAMVLALRRAVSALPNVTLRTSARVDALVVESARVKGVITSNGDEHRAALVVGADGRQSKLRSLLGLEGELQLLSYTVAVSVEGDVLPHPGHGHVFLGAPGPVLAYPFGHGKVRMCIDVPWGAAKGKDAIKAYVAREYAAAVPEPLRSAMLASLAEHPLEGCANHSLSTLQVASPGAVLVGDAGGCSHPLTATGMTSGLNDVLELCGALAEAGGPTDDAVLEYQRRRASFVRARHAFTEALYEVFRGEDAGSAALRDGVFRYWASDERARTASIRILCGEDSGPLDFVREYTTVMASSAAEVASRALRSRRPLGMPLRWYSLMSTALARLERTANQVGKAAWGVRRLGFSYPAPSTSAARRRDTTPPP